MTAILAALMLLQQPPAFEVASVRAHQGNDFRPAELKIASSLVRMRGYTIFGLAMDAFHVKDYQLRFANVTRPEDIYDDRYDISARAPGEGVPESAAVREMLRTLLAERFQLRYHREMKEMDVYALVPAKGGSKLRKSTGDGPCVAKTRLAPDGRNDIETFRACTLDDFAERLGNVMGERRPVIDRTNERERFDFQLVVTPGSRTLRGSDPADISPFTAVTELGLKLVPQKSSVEIVVIDQVSKPSEN